MSSTKNATASEQNAEAESCEETSAPVEEHDSLVPSADESALMEMLHRRIDSRPPALAKLMRADLELAEGRVVHLATDLNPYGHFQFILNLQREFRRAKKDGTPELFQIPDAEGVTYPELMAAWVEEGQWITTQRGARVTLDPEIQVMTLTDALKAADHVRLRTQVVIDGNGSEPEVADALRLFVWDKRRTPVSRPAMLNHLGLAATAIRSLATDVRKALETPANEIPKEARHLKGEALRDAERKLSPWVPSVQRAVLALERALPLLDQAIGDLTTALDGRQTPSSIEAWGFPVQVLVTAQDLALNAFLRHAGVTAAPHRLPTFVNLLAPRRDPDNVPVSAPDPDAPPAEDETVIPFAETDEAELIESGES